MKRRNFIKTTILAGGALNLPSISFASQILKSDKKVTILHTNDQHSRIDPFPPTYAHSSNKGGFARRATLIEAIRQEEPQVLLLDSGDVFQGTPYFNFFGGELEFKLMSKMGYEASTMGNHEFDNGLEGFKKQLPHAQFDFLCSNYDFTNTILEGLTKDYKIINKGGIKIGIFGIGVELEGLVEKKNYLETIYLDPIEIAQDRAYMLKKEKKCDLVICLSHIGYKYPNFPNKVCDVQLCQQTSHIDLVLGGHTHTFFKEPEKYINKEGKEVLLNQVGWAGLLLGRIDYLFTQNNKLKEIAFQTIPIEDYTV
ncbi:bifunctional UDP-sugar hydrolase/5'-nucleotidase [uncultured Apibacter sp.]|uniref:bifunctional metallophosphatase/5'-nucleotidase n=1 Tax=uncultured Apibacter sp. TaxID=1778616 RepID=UPI0025DD9000|nr:metallophosphatase [uncultured Apibacter sp.]